MVWDGWIECDAMRLDCDWGWAARQRGRQGRQAGVHMPTELKPALWGTSSMSHPLTGTLEELVTGCIGAPIGHSGPCQPDAP